MRRAIQHFGFLRREAPDETPAQAFRRKLDRHQTAFALGETIAHLHYLIGQGEIERHRDPDGVDRFVSRA